MKIYYSSFLDIYNTEYRLEISKDGYTGEPQEIILAANPININYAANEDIYKPTKLSGASIKILTRDVIEELYTSKITDIRIDIYKGNALFWSGFVTPNDYNQPYSDLYDLVQIECIDRLSALQYFKYKQLNQNENQVLSFYQLLKNILTDINNDGLIDTIEYYCNFDNENTNILNELKASERNWFDEENEASTCMEVLEHIGQFLGVTIYTKANKIIMLPIDGFKHKNTFKVATYKLSDNTISINNKTFNEIQGICVQNTCDVSLGDVYNQVNVLGNIIDMDDDLFNLGDIDDAIVDGETNRIDIITKKDSNYEYTRIFYQFLINPNWQYLNNKLPDWHINPLYVSDVNNIRKFVREATVKPNWFSHPTSDRFTGAFPNTTSLNWNTYFVYNIGERISKSNGLNYIDVDYLTGITGNEVLSKTTSTDMAYPKDGYFILHLNARFSRYIGKQTLFATGVTKNDTDNYLLSYNKNKPKANEDSIWRNYFGFKARLQVGNKYYYSDGKSAISEWRDEPCDFIFRTEEKYSMNALGASYDNAEWGDDWDIYNDNYFRVKTKSDKQGWLIPITEDLYGKVKLTLYDCLYEPTDTNSGRPMTLNFPKYDYIQLNQFDLEYTPKDEVDPFAIVNTKDKNKDLKYSADIDIKNVTEFSDITMYLNTYNKELLNSLSYSYVFIDKNGKREYLQQIEKWGETLRPEEHVVQMYVEHYEKPRIHYNNTIKYQDNIEPICLVKPAVTDNQYNLVGKKFIVGNYDFSLEYNRINIELIEI